MTCDDYAVWISMELDGELDPAEAGLLRRHLASCAPCRALGEDYRVNHLLLHAMSPLRAPQDGLQRLQQKVGRAASDRTDALPRAPLSASPTRRWRAAAPRRGWRWQTALQSVAVLVLVFTGSIFWLGYTDVEPPSVLPIHPSAPVAVQQPAALLRGHALVLATNPLADQSAWHYLASEALRPFMAYSADTDPTAVDVRTVEPAPPLRDEGDPQ